MLDGGLRLSLDQVLATQSSICGKVQFPDLGKQIGPLVRVQLRPECQQVLLLMLWRVLF